MNVPIELKKCVVFKIFIDFFDVKSYEKNKSYPFSIRIETKNKANSWCSKKEINSIAKRRKTLDNNWLSEKNPFKFNIIILAENYECKDRKY